MLRKNQFSGKIDTHDCHLHDHLHDGRLHDDLQLQVDPCQSWQGHWPEFLRPFHCKKYCISSEELKYFNDFGHILNIGVEINEAVGWLFYLSKSSACKTPIQKARRSVIWIILNIFKNGGGAVTSGVFWPSTSDPGHDFEPLVEKLLQVFGIFSIARHHIPSCRLSITLPRISLHPN